MNADSLNQKKHEPFQILCLSGGGYRGLFTAKVLADLEEEFGAPIARHFDLIAGTSIGGILALALSLEIPAKKMVDLFLENGTNIFQARRNFFGYVRSTYSQDGLRTLLESDEIFGEQLLGASRHRVIVPTLNYTSGSPELFKTPHHADFRCNHKQRLVDIALATSAAPSFFPRHRFNASEYIDGGLFANAPGELAVHEAQHYLGNAIEHIRLVSIGTMSVKVTRKPKENNEGGALDWGGYDPSRMPKKLFALSISAQEQIADFRIRHLLGDNYVHLDEQPSPEAAELIGLDKTDTCAQQVLLGNATMCAKKAIGNPKVTKIFTQIARQPNFHYGEYATTSQGK